MSLTSEESCQVSELLSGAGTPTIMIQLQGNDVLNRWEDNKFLNLCRRILGLYPRDTIFDIDSPEARFTNLDYVRQRILDLSPVTTIAQDIGLIQAVDLWIAQIASASMSGAG